MGGRKKRRKRRRKRPTGGSIYYKDPDLNGFTPFELEALRRQIVKR